MQYRFRLAVRCCAALTMVAFLAACGGGGGGGSTGGGGGSTGGGGTGGGGGGVTPPVTPTTPPVTTVPAAGIVLVPGKQSSGGGAGGFVNNGKTPSTYTVTSNPTGQSFTVAGASYVTPATVTPATSYNPLVIAFSGGFSVPIVQVYDGPHTVYYNATSASTGSVALTTLLSKRRVTAGLKAGAPVALHRRMPAFRSRVDVDPTRVAVRLSASALRTSGRSPADVERAVGSVGRDTLSATADRLRVVTVPAGVSVAAFTRSLQAQPEVAEVSSVHVRHLLARTPTAVTDPYFTLPDAQWYTHDTGTDSAWSYSPGTGAKIAIIDTGIDEANTDLTSQLVFQETAVTPIDNTPTAANGGNPTCLPVTGATTVVTPNTAVDDDGHGTNVAGIAISKENTAGFAGAAWGAGLMAFKVFPSQNAYCNDAASSTNFGADTADEAQAIADAVAQGADVISLSLGEASLDQTEFNAIESAIASGVTVVAAAGNSDDASTPGTLDYPSAYPGVISVGASALSDEFYTTQQPQSDGTYATSTEIVASYSQYGPSLGVVAPGGDASPCVGTTCDQDLLHWIANYSTSTAYLPADQCSNITPATNCVALFSGTSMATPQVAATAAMLTAEAGGHRSLTPAAISYLIESTADNINDAKQGHGRLNAYRALAGLIRDTSAYSGPIAQKTGTSQLVAFAYSTGNTNRPRIVDASFPAGVPVASDGTFMIADVPLTVPTYGIAVWYDANGDGVVDAGDEVGVASAKCSSASACHIGAISMKFVQTGFYLP